MKTRDIGNIGEDLALRHLEDSGYKIVERNYPCKYGEVDIIARKKDTLVFVEVKARKSNAFGGPIAAVSKDKQKKLTLTSLFFIKSSKIKYNNVRFDVITILDGNDIEHIENAFVPDRFSY
jgi:putative endonuclease